MEGLECTDIGVIEDLATGDNIGPPRFGTRRERGQALWKIKSRYRG
jgi:hypothetical protein